MTIFYQGSLQEGIALAVREAKAVVCFVRDDAQLSSTWESEYFSDNEVSQALRNQSVLLRLTAGTQEARFLSSFCPIAEFPAVIVIKNGKMEEYLLPGISKDDFKNRILAVLGQQKAPTLAPTQQPQASTLAVNNTSSSSNPTTTSAATSTQANRQPSQGTLSPSTSAPQRSQELPTPKEQPAKQESKPSPAKPPARRQDKGKNPAQVPDKKANTTSQKPTKPATRKPLAPTVEDPKPQPQAPRGPPSEYRLQVRLFDGRSIRSSFTPTQTIRNDVRPWLDEQMTEDKRPYNLKQILTPLPNRTLSVAEESQPLRDLGLGSTANLVMVPVASYTEAYANAAASLPARGISAVYNVVSSVASSATSLVGSFIGYGPSAAEDNTQTSASNPPPPSETPRRPSRTGGLNIRTLHDQRNERNDSQFYNGNQLNFEPRNQDRKDD